MTIEDYREYIINQLGSDFKPLFDSQQLFAYAVTHIVELGDIATIQASLDANRSQQKQQKIDALKAELAKLTGADAQILP